jgi:hypothetical protein
MPYFLWEKFHPDTLEFLPFVKACVLYLSSGDFSTQKCTTQYNILKKTEKFHAKNGIHSCF